MLTFRKFKDAEAARDLILELEQANISAAYVNTTPPFDPSYSFNHIEAYHEVRLAAADFDKATEVLLLYYKSQLTAIPADYYLFHFSKEELMAILKAPDEWGELDYVLAQEILTKKGAAPEPAELQKFKEERKQLLAKPEQKDAKSTVLWGYGFSAFGGIIGSLIGWYLMSAQKVLPDGTKVYVYTEHDRRHGRIICTLGLIVMGAALGIRLYSSYLSSR